MGNYWKGHLPAWDGAGEPKTVPCHKTGKALTVTPITVDNSKAGGTQWNRHLMKAGPLTARQCHGGLKTSHKGRYRVLFFSTNGTLGNNLVSGF